MKPVDSDAPAEPPPNTDDGGNPVREQTQRIPAVVLPRAPARRRAEPSRAVMVVLMVVAPLVIMGGGVLLVGRVLRPDPVSPTSSPTRPLAASATPASMPASEPPSVPPPRTPLVAEEIVTVAQPQASPPRAAAPEIGLRPVPVASAPAARPTPRSLVLPSAKPSEPSPEQLRAQQLMALLAQAETALSGARYEDAARGFDEALKLDAASPRASAGRTRALWAASAVRRAFVVGKTVNAPVKSGKGPAGFDTEDVEVKAQDFLCDVAIEIQPATLRPGQSLDYRAAISLTSAGKKAINVKSVQANLTLNGARSSEPLTPLVRNFPTKQRALLAEAKGAWVEGMVSWGLEVVITGEKGDVCRNAVNWR